MSLLLNEKNPVRVTADAAGCIVSQSKNPEYGYIRLVQEKTSVKDGFVRSMEVSALLQGPMEKLKEMAKNLKEGDPVKGSIAIKESLVPFNFSHPEKDLKVASSTGIPCTLKGEPIYRKTVFTFADDVEDTLIEHDNVQELRSAYAANQVTVDSKVEEDFNL